MTVPNVREHNVDFVKGPLLTEYITSDDYEEKYFV